MSFLCLPAVLAVLVNIHHSPPKPKTREMSLPHRSCQTNVQLHRELLKNDGKGVSSNTQDIFKANILEMHKVSLQSIIDGAAPGCKSEWHHRWKVWFLKSELRRDYICVRFRFWLNLLQTPVVYSVFATLLQFSHTLAVQVTYCWGIYLKTCPVSH